MTTWLAVLIGMLGCSANVSAPGQQVLPHRSWQFHDAHGDYLRQAIPKAKAAGMNRIQLSHQIVMDAEQLWQGAGHEQRLALVRKAADATPEELQAIREQARAHIKEMRTWAGRMEERYGKDIWPGNPERLRHFAHEAEKQLSK